MVQKVLDNVNGNRLSDKYVFIKGFKSWSGSRTDFWIIKEIDTGKKFMLKLFIESQKGIYTPVYERQKHEVRTYSSLKQYLIVQENVRNILPYVANGSEPFRDLLEFVYRGCKKNGNNINKKEISHNLLQNVRFMLKQVKRREYTVRVDKRPTTELEKFEDYFNSKTFVFSYIITEYITNQVSFADFIYSYSPTKREISKYMAVICTTLFQMSQLGINQNDLHFGNILMDMTNKFSSNHSNHYFQKVYLIVFENKTFIIDNPYTPLIFDFDRASIYNRPFKVLKNYENGGNCAYYDKKRDFIRALCCLYRELTETGKIQLHEFAKRMIQSLIKDETYKELIYKPEQFITASNSSSIDGAVCHLPTEDKTTSYQCFSLTNVLVPLPEILSFFFEHAKFKSVNTRLLFENHPAEVQIVAKEMNRWGLKNIRLKDRYMYVEKNIQFVTKCSIQSQKKIIQNICQAFP